LPSSLPVRVEDKGAREELEERYETVAPEIAVPGLEEVCTRLP